ncbi:MAG: AAA family ATPase [Oceanococcus sp.]|nr:MAG: AAA family ATPase [Oceanococcus sp.]
MTIESIAQQRFSDMAAQSLHRRVELLSVDEMLAAIKPIDWLINGFIERGTLALIYGPPGCGKSLLAIEMACCVATGSRWFDQPTKEGAVIYIAGEGHSGLTRRVGAWELHHGVSLSSRPIKFSSSAVSLRDSAEVDDLSSQIRQFSEASAVPPKLIIVDTLARNFGEGNENDAADMGEFVQCVDRQLRQAWDAAVLIIHHCGKDPSKGARGSTALMGAVDAAFSVDRKPSGTVRMACHKMKDSEPPEPLTFAIEGVDIPVAGDDGELVSAPVLVQFSSGSSRPRQTRGLGSNQQKALDCLLDLFGLVGDDSGQSGAQREREFVHINEWRDLCDFSGKTSSDIAKAFKRAKDALEERNLISVQGSRVFLESGHVG